MAVLAAVRMPELTVPAVADQPYSVMPEASPVIAAVPAALSGFAVIAAVIAVSIAVAIVEPSAEKS